MKGNNLCWINTTYAIFETILDFILTYVVKEIWIRSDSRSDRRSNSFLKPGHSGIYKTQLFDDERNFCFIFEPFSFTCIAADDAIVESRSLFATDSTFFMLEHFSRWAFLLRQIWITDLKPKLDRYYYHKSCSKLSRKRLHDSNRITTFPAYIILRVHLRCDSGTSQDEETECYNVTFLKQI